MKHRLARNKALSRAIRSKAWAQGRDPALLAKFEAWLEHVVARAEQQAERELAIEEALDCVAAATYADFDAYDKQALGDLAVALERELQRVRGLLELAKA